MKPARLTWILLTLFTLVVLIGLYGPIVVTVAGAFLPVKGGMIQSFDLTFDAFLAIAHDPGIVRALVLTLVVGAVATLAAIVLGTAIALYYASGRSFDREVLRIIVFVPFVMPPILTGLALLVFFRTVEIDRSLVTVVIGHVILILAVAYQTIVTRLMELSRSLTEASLDLGASRWQTFRLVILPNLTGAIGAAAVLSFAISFDETMVTLLLTGTDSTFPIRLWGMMRLGVTPAVNALLALLVAVTIVVCAVAVRVLVPKARPT